MLFKPNWKKLSAADSLKRIDRIDDPALLLDAVLQSEHKGVKMAAIAKMTDLELLLRIAESSADTELRLHCLTRIPENTKAQTRLTDTLIGLSRVDFPMPKIVKKAIGLLTPENRARVAVQARHYCIYTEAVEAVTDQAVLGAYVRKYPDAVPIAILDRLDGASLEYIAQNNTVQAALRKMACGKLGHLPDGKNKCACSVCGCAADASRDPALSLHDFEGNVCKRCGAVRFERTEKIAGRDGRQAAHADQTVVRYADGEERVVCSRLCVERPEQYYVND